MPSMLSASRRSACVKLRTASTILLACAAGPRHSASGRGQGRWAKQRHREEFVGAALGVLERRVQLDCGAAGAVLGVEANAILWDSHLGPIGASLARSRADLEAHQRSGLVAAAPENLAQQVHAVGVVAVRAE
jgi:hypothetical protein